MDAERVADNVRRVEGRIAAAQARSGRSAAVTIVAVTKTHGPEAVRAARAAGLRDCGENRVQELVTKHDGAGDDVAWHLIGHLQRNKVKQVLPLIEMMQAVDSVRLAEALSAAALQAGRRLRVLVQVNASGEATKGGFAVASAVAEIARCAELPGLQVEGLMTLAPFTDDEAVLRRTFGAVRGLAESCAGLSGYGGRHLSMGMSNDFEVAVEEGSTMVRLGTILFGARASHD